MFALSVIRHMNRIGDAFSLYLISGNCGTLAILALLGGRGTFAKIKTPKFLFHVNDPSIE